MQISVTLPSGSRSLPVSLCSVLAVKLLFFKRNQNRKKVDQRVEKQTNNN